MFFIYYKGELICDVWFYVFCSIDVVFKIIKFNVVFFVGWVLVVELNIDENF